jgi:hypothetical protein
MMPRPKKLEIRKNVKSIKEPEPPIKKPKEKYPPNPPPQKKKQP